MRIELLRSNSHRIILFISYVLVFIIGFYMPRDSSRLHQSPSKNYVTLLPITAKHSTHTPKKHSLYDLGMKYNTDKVTAHHYDKIYEKNLRKYVGSTVILLEIGLGCGMNYGIGASARVWRHYLGDQADIHFIENNKTCGESWHKVHGKKLGVTMHYGSQEDVAFLKTIRKKHDYFDIIIDDGGHTIEQQITSFTYLSPKVRTGGLYVIEDLETSYAKSQNGTQAVNTTTIGLIKRLLDDIQIASLEKSTNLSSRIFSFEISSNICFFNIK